LIEIKPSDPISYLSFRPKGEIFPHKLKKDFSAAYSFEMTAYKLCKKYLDDKF